MNIDQVMGRWTALDSKVKVLMTLLFEGRDTFTLYDVHAACQDSFPPVSAASLKKKKFLKETSAGQYRITKKGLRLLTNEKGTNHG